MHPHTEIYVDAACSINRPMSVGCYMVVGERPVTFELSVGHDPFRAEMHAIKQCVMDLFDSGQRFPIAASPRFRTVIYTDCKSFVDLYNGNSTTNKPDINDTIAFIKRYG